MTRTSSILGGLLLAALVAAGCGAARSTDARPTAVQESPDGLAVPQLVDIGRALRERGDTVRAQQYWVRAIAQGADAGAVLPLLLSSYIEDGQYRLAILRAEDHLKHHPRDLRLRLLLGTLHEAIGEYQAAIDDYAAVIAQEPARAAGHYALASALLQQGHDRLRADVHFRRYLDLEPDGPYAEHARASLLTEIAP